MTIRDATPVERRSWLTASGSIACRALGALLLLPALVVLALRPGDNVKGSRR